MTENDPFSQMFNLVAAPLAGTIQSFEQFRKGVDEFYRGVENFNRTMENLNETAERINRLLSDVEEPLRATVPQVTRTVKAADDMMKVVAGPAMAVAPGLQILAETLNNPALRQMPNQVSQMNEMLAEVTARLAPLGQLAESAGGLLGFRLPGFGGGPSRNQPAEALDDAEDDESTPETAREKAEVAEIVVERIPVGTATAKKKTAKKTATKTASGAKPAKKKPAKKTTKKTAPAKK